MEFFRDTQINFMKYRKVWMLVSLVFVLLGIGALFSHQHLNLGIDFAGGTQITLKFKDKPDVERLRKVLDDAGVDDAQIQRFGEVGSNEVIVKTPVLQGSEEGSLDTVTSALDADMGGGGAGLDLNKVGPGDLTDLFVREDPDGVSADQGEEEARSYYEGVANALMEVRREDGLIQTWDQLDRAEGVSPAVLDTLKTQTHLSDYAVLAVENVGPQIGRELSTRGILAVALSLVGMLIYIWLRFELRYGVGAVTAVFHDTLVCLGIYALFDFEFNLTTIAAFLTLIGYSVNDTVVVFDRVRENLRKNRRQPLIEVMNESLNQTLSRTILTSGTTLLAVGTLLVYGGDVLRGFAFVLTVGIVVGTYSSIYVASPVALLWDQLFGTEARTRRQASRRAA
jgi:preprotein translocase subunit SecF